MIDYALDLAPGESWAFKNFASRYQLKIAVVCNYKSSVLCAMRFEWDEEKAAQNLAKHKVPFDFAARVFLDPYHWTPRTRGSITARSGGLLSVGSNGGFTPSLTRRAARLPG